MLLQFVISQSVNYRTSQQNLFYQRIFFALHGADKIYLRGNKIYN